MGTAHFRRRTWLFAACSSVLAAMSFASVAQGAIAGGGQQFSTNRPDLVSAAVNDTLIQNYVDVCFDTSIQLDPGVSNSDFQLTGVNVLGDLENPINVSTHPSNTNCLRLLFDANTNLGSYTVLEVAQDVVRPAGGAALGNKEAAAQLDNTDVEPVIGRIGGPNLLTTIPVDVGGGPGTGAVQYNFDKDIEGADASLFGYYGPDGEFEEGDSIFSTSGGSVIVVFTGLSGDDPTPSVATRFFALSGAVELADRDAAVNDNRAESIGGAVPGRPDLVSVSEVAGQQGVYDMQYNQLIQPNELDDCRAVLSVGDHYMADSAQVIGNGSVLRVTFLDLTSLDLGAELNSDDEVVRIVDEGRPVGGCVQDLNTSRSSTTKSIALRLGDNVPGFTSGPDLTGCLGSPTSNEVRFIFDELLSVLPTFTPDPGDFEIFSTTGGVVSGNTVRDVTENTISIIFPGGGPLTNAAACHVYRGEVLDRDPRLGIGFDPNPAGTVRFNSDGSTPVGTIPTGGGTIFVPVPGPTTTVTNTVTGPGGAAAAIVRRTPQSLTLNARCTPRGGGRYTCRVSGKLTQDNRVRALGRSKACTGSVKVQYKSGTKTVSTRLPFIRQSSCTYKGTVNFNKPDRLTSGLKVRARYNGNKYSKTKFSRTVVVIRR